MNRTSKSPTPRKRARQTLAFLRDGDPSDTKVSTVVFGPYRDRGKYRLVVVEGKKRKSLVAETIDEAERLKSKLSAAIVESAARTVSEVLPEYEAYLTDERTAASAPVRRRMVERFLGAESTLGGFTHRRASDLYAAEVARVTVRGRPTAAAAHRSYLSEAKRFFKWAEARGYVSSNPFADVRPVGRPKVGKAQLRIDEARRFTQTALEAAQGGDRAALAALLALMLGARANEILRRVVRDVDDGAAILWIPYGKTKNAKRRLTTPVALRPLLAKLTEGKPADAYLFPSPFREGRPVGDTWLWNRVQALCDAAGVPRVCTHSLRGLHATLSVGAGLTSEHVAASLGHASFAITAKHYADPSAIADRNTQEVTSTLLGAKPDVSLMIRQASELSPTERSELRAALDRLCEA